MRPSPSLRRALQAIDIDAPTARARIASYDKHINAFVRTSPAPAPSHTEGDEVKGKVSGGGSLAGWPIAVKDSICTKDMGTGCASRMLEGFEPGYDATVVRLLRARGAEVVGKTNCDEFGMGSMNTHSIHGPVRNPHGTPAALPFPLSSSFSSSSSTPPPEEWPPSARVAGGSSGGSAAAVRAGMCIAALGTDTGGSTRLPAAYCGVVGLKPSYGLLSRYGVVAFADSLDCVGILADSVSRARTVFGALNVHDPRDPTSVGEERREEVAGAVRRRIRALDFGKGNLGGLRVGVPQEYFPREMAESVRGPVRRVLRSLKERGAEIVPVEMWNTRYALSAYYVLASAEASSCLARYDGVQYGLNVRAPPGTDLSRMSVGQVYTHTRSAGFGAEVQRRVLLGAYALSAGAFDNYFLQAQRVRELVRGDFGRVLGAGGVDVLVHGSAVGSAPELGCEGEGYVQDVLTVPASLGGVPALSVPVEGDDGWPTGVSVVGAWGAEELVLGVGEVVERG